MQPPFDKKIIKLAY